MVTSFRLLTPLDLLVSPLGTKMSIDLVLFAVEAESFCDSIQVRMHRLSFPPPRLWPIIPPFRSYYGGWSQIKTPTGCQVLEIKACIMDGSAWLQVVRRLRLEDRPALRPGVSFMGLLDKGERKYVVTTENPSQKRSRRPLFSTDRDMR